MRNSQRFGVNLTFLALALLAAPATASAADYYVDSVAGNDSGAGNMGAPWKTLSKAQSQSLTAGDRLLFARGSTFTGSLDVTASGTANAPITLTSYGSGPLPLFTNASFADNNGNSIIVHGSYVVIDGLGFADGAPAPDYGAVGVTGAVHIYPGANHAVVTNSDFKNAPIGIRVGGENALITHNHIHDCTRMLQGDLWGPIGVFVSTSGVEIAYNRFENYAVLGDLSAFGGDGGSIEVDSQNAPGGGALIQDLNVHHNVSIGNVGFIEVTPVNGGGKNLKLSYNLVDDVLQGFLFHEATNITFENNTIRRINAPVILKSGEPAEETVLYAGAVTGLSLKNNIFLVRDDLLVYGDGLPVGSVHSNNVYFAPGNPDPLGSVALGAGEVVGDPKFVDVATRNLHLLSGSPAIDAGAVLGYTQDLLGRGVPFGSAPDIGALEFQGPDGMTGPIGDPSGSGGAASGSGGASSGSGGASQVGGAPGSSTGGVNSASGGGGTVASSGGAGPAVAGGSVSVFPNPGTASGGARAAGGATGSQVPGSGGPGTSASRGQAKSGCGLVSPPGQSSSLLAVAGLAVAACASRRRARA
ncbi:MAG: right-handed parallel beta-helix repeat-containing protein [Polyangiaceae bacterium]|nr:right-handed parallel beta-helix repeat-containing protein [Polyangiaceae bacterium]